MQANVNRPRSSRTLKPEDFCPELKVSRKGRTPAEAVQVLQAQMSSMGVQFKEADRGNHRDH